MYPHTLEVAARPLPYFRTPEFSAMMLDSEQMLRRLLDAPADSYMAVSYTHLDVYKRQSLDR